MKAVILVSLLFAGIVAAAQVDYESSFVDWMREHGKTYHHDEFQARFQIYKKNVDYVNSVNAEKRSYSLRINKFADLTSEEFAKFYLGTPLIKTPVYLDEEIIEAVPASVNWTAKGAVTHIKNQGQCGSCWSFSTTGSTEGCHFINHGKLISLSEQQLVDCSGSYGNDGCNGGLMDDAFQYIEAVGGLETEDQYPYTAEAGTCVAKKNLEVVTVTGYHDVPSGSENALQQQVVKGPVSVAIDASQSDFQFYNNGVYYNAQCSSTQLDHGVLAVGYGTDSGSDYWLVKNSWGTDWGLEGYIMMSRNKNNNCGIATAASQPTC